ncbi:MAG: hypothetical protein AAGI30_13980 [Planctomycetota bacterium]
MAFSRTPGSDPRAELVSRALRQARAEPEAFASGAAVLAERLDVVLRIEARDDRASGGPLEWDTDPVQRSYRGLCRVIEAVTASGVTAQRSATPLGSLINFDAGHEDPGVDRVAKARVFVIAFVVCASEEIPATVRESLRDYASVPWFPELESDHPGIGRVMLNWGCRVDDWGEPSDPSPRVLDRVEAALDVLGDGAPVGDAEAALATWPVHDPERARRARMIRHGIRETHTRRLVDLALRLAREMDDRSFFELLRRARESQRPRRRSAQSRFDATPQADGGLSPGYVISTWSGEDPVLSFGGADLELCDRAGQTQTIPVLLDAVTCRDNTLKAESRAWIEPRRDEARAALVEVLTDFRAWLSEPDRQPWGVSPVEPHKTVPVELKVRSVPPGGPPVRKVNGWTRAELCEHASISASTFDTIRKDAKVASASRGGGGAQRRFSPAQLDRFIAVVEEGSFHKAGDITAQWRELLAECVPANHK